MLCERIYKVDDTTYRLWAVFPGRITAVKTPTSIGIPVGRFTPEALPCLYINALYDRFGTLDVSYGNTALSTTDEEVKRATLEWLEVEAVKLRADAWAFFKERCYNDEKDRQLVEELLKGQLAPCPRPAAFILIELS